MTILLHKLYFSKVSTNVEGGAKMFKNGTTWYMDDTIVNHPERIFL